MFRLTTIAGLPMSSRRNRRMLVILTYLGIAALTVVMGVFNGIHFLSPLWMIIIFSGVSRGVFGAVVPQQTFRERAQTPLEARLGLSASPTLGEPQEDERDIAVRDAAYFSAFKIVTLFALFVWFAVLMFQDPSIHMPPIVLQLIATGLVVLVLTLPQAIMLWRHPDLIEEV